MICFQAEAPLMSSGTLLRLLVLIQTPPARSFKIARPLMRAVFVPFKAQMCLITTSLTLERRLHRIIRLMDLPFSQIMHRNSPPPSKPYSSLLEHSAHPVLHPLHRSHQRAWLLGTGCFYQYSHQLPRSDSGREGLHSTHL